MTSEKNPEAKEANKTCWEANSGCGCFDINCIRLFVHSIDLIMVRNDLKLLMSYLSLSLISFPQAMFSLSFILSSLCWTGDFSVSKWPFSHWWPFSHRFPMWPFSHWLVQASKGFTYFARTPSFCIHSVFTSNWQLALWIYFLLSSYVSFISFSYQSE